MSLVKCSEHVADGLRYLLRTYRRAHVGPANIEGLSDGDCQCGAEGEFLMEGVL